MVLTLNDLIAYATQQARIQQIDYFDPRYARPDEVSAWRADCRHRSNDRRNVFRGWPARLNKGTEQLVPGKYGRLTITETDIDFTPCQYAPLEVWCAVALYLHSTN